MCTTMLLKCVYHFFAIIMACCPKECYCNDIAEGEAEQTTVLIPACAQVENASVLAPLAILSCHYEVHPEKGGQFM